MVNFYIFYRERKTLTCTTQISVFYSLSHFSEVKSLRIRIRNDASVNIHMINYSHIL